MVTDCIIDSVCCKNGGKVFEPVHLFSIVNTFVFHLLLINFHEEGRRIVGT